MAADARSHSREYPAHEPGAKERIGVKANGFRTPGGFADRLSRPRRLATDAARTWDSIGSAASTRATQEWSTCAPAQDGPSDEAYREYRRGPARAQPFVYPTGLLDIPMSPISDIGAFRNGRWKLDHFLQAIRLAMDWAIESRAVFDFLATRR